MDHGFGTGKLTVNKLTNQPATKEDLEKIAECIAEVDGVLWSHVVVRHTNPDDHYELIWEEWKRCDDNAIKKCAKASDYGITPHHTTIRNKSYKKDKVPDKKHPKKDEY